MTRYAVELTDTAFRLIADQARYIALVDRAPDNARSWLEQVWDAVDSLELWPRRGALDEETRYVEYEVRQLVVFHHLLLYTIDDERGRVVILGIRHGRRLPRPEDLPGSGDAARG